MASLTPRSEWQVQAPANSSQHHFRDLNEHDLAFRASVDYRILLARKHPDDAGRILANDIDNVPFLNLTSYEIVDTFIPDEIAERPGVGPQGLCRIREQIRQYIVLRRGAQALNTVNAELMTLKLFAQFCVDLPPGMPPFSEEAALLFIRTASGFKVKNSQPIGDSSAETGLTLLSETPEIQLLGQLKRADHQQPIKPTYLKLLASTLKRLLTGSELCPSIKEVAWVSALKTSVKTLNSQINRFNDQQAAKRKSFGASDYEKEDVAAPLLLEDLEILTEIALASGDDQQLRDMLILRVAWESMCRRSEYTRFCVQHLRKRPESGFTDNADNFEWVIPKSKTDQSGQGLIGGISNDTVRLVRFWLDRMQITSGPVFPTFKPVGRAKNTKRRKVKETRTKKVGDLTIEQPPFIANTTLAEIFRRSHLRVAEHLGIYDPKTSQNEDFVHSEAFISRWLTPRLWSSHSPRVGATVHMIRNDVPVPLIVKKARWKSEAMVYRYSRLVKGNDAGATEAAITDKLDEKMFKFGHQ